jgi:hypothetical protein
MAVLTLVLAAYAGQAQELGARARIDSSVYLVGDRIAVHVDLRHTKGLTIQPLVADSLGGFSLLGRTPLQATTDTTSTIDFVIARYDSGDAVVPPIPFMYFVGGDTASRVAITNQLRVTITTVQLDTTGEIRDVKPPFSIPLSLEEIVLYSGIVLLIAALGYAGFRFWKKRRARRKGEVYVPPPRPAHSTALEELALLKEKQLWQRGLVKQYYSELTEILRRYFENRYRLPALEETTDEIVAGLSKQSVDGPIVASAESILRRADLVKFAKHQPAMPEHEESIAGVYSVVDRTKAIEMTPVSAQADGGRTDVES